MNNALTATVALAGLIFSLSFALLLEELLFGMVFRLMACSKRIAAEVKKQPPMDAANRESMAKRLVI